MKRDVAYRYFVYQHEGGPYRVYGTYRYYEPEDDDPRCAWRGDDYKVALAEAKKANSNKEIGMSEVRWYKCYDNKDDLYYEAESPYEDLKWVLRRRKMSDTTNRYEWYECHDVELMGDVVRSWATIAMAQEAILKDHLSIIEEEENTEYKGFPSKKLYREHLGAEITIIANEIEVNHPGIFDPPPPTVDLTDIRRAVANYMRSEGCGYCSNRDAHEKHAANLAGLLDVPMYDDGSGYNFGLFASQGNRAT